MNNLVLIRGGKVAFSYFPGCFGDNSSNGFDLEDLVTPFGLFLPVIDHGLQVLPFLDDTYMINPGAMRSTFDTVTGMKGVLLASSPMKDAFFQLRMTSEGRITWSPLATGQHGFAIITPYNHLELQMAMAVRLTTTIEDAVDMYCRHVMTDRRKVMIWDRKKLSGYLKRHWVPKVNAILDRPSQEET
jgi:hypothetical protein